MPAIPLPNGKTVFLDDDGTPLAVGTVEFYEPGGLTPKDTYQNYLATIRNDNPLTLDAAGRAIIFGTGRYRQIVKREDGTTVWDQETDGYLTIPTAYAYHQASFAGSSPPAASLQFYRAKLPAAVTYPADFADPDSTWSSGTNPTAQYVFTVLKNGSSIGTVTIATNGAATFATAGHVAIEAAKDDVITIVGQGTPDATLNNFGLIISGTWA